jgi:hypothetical protein
MSILTPAKKLTAVFALAAATILSGCGPHVAVTPPDGQGHGMNGVQCTVSQVFRNTVAQKACVVDAAQLQKGTTYDFDGGLLTVRGNVADGVSIAVTNGKLYIDGDVQKGADVEARVPENWTTDTILMPMIMSDGNGGTTIILMPMPQSRFVGYVHADDSDPAVIIHGSVEKGASVYGDTGAMQHAGPGFNASPAIQQTLALK